MRIIYVILIVFILLLSMEVYSIINPGVKPIKKPIATKKTNCCLLKGTEQDNVRLIKLCQTKNSWSRSSLKPLSPSHSNYFFDWRVGGQDQGYWFVLGQEAVPFSQSPQEWAWIAQEVSNRKWKLGKSDKFFRRRDQPVDSGPLLSPRPKSQSH